MDAPYVGLRPYEESERDLLYGRGDDAARLVNKVFSNTVTLLYAASGVGKTSLLRSLVVPAIRSQEAIPIYFDAWGGPDPIQGLKRAWLAADLNRPTDDESILSRVLPDIVMERFGAGHDIVLILDQFETFLIRHARRPEALQAELGALTRRCPWVHVLISLREEFLAGLNSFRVDIPMIYSSNYRLERLSGDAARQAIAAPALRWGKSVEDSLIDRLLDDLRADDSSETDPQAALQAEGIEAPFLQLVCRHLWLVAERDGSEKITLAQYNAAGGKDAIIRAYIADVTNTFHGRQTSDAARILQYLAPPSGVKNSLSQMDLHELTALPVERIDPILSVLAKKIVLRVRQPTSARADVRYELYHDAFTRVLRPWIAGVLRRNRIKQVLLRTGGIVLILGAAGWYLWSDYNYREERLAKDKADKELVLAEQVQRQEVAKQRDKAQTDDRIKFLLDKGKEAPRYAREILGSVALYLLDLRENDAIDRLERLLKEADAKGAILNDYGLDRVQMEAEPAKESNPDDEQPPLTLELSASEFGENGTDRFAAAQMRLANAWRHRVLPLEKRLGVPIPDKLQIVSRKDLEPGKTIVRATGTSLERTLQDHPEAVGAVLVDDAKHKLYRSFALDAPVTSSDCTAPQANKVWLHVARWAMPLWYIIGDARVAHEILLTCALAKAIEEEPALVVNDSTVSRFREVLDSPFVETIRLAESRVETEGITQRILSELGRSRPIVNLPNLISDIAETANQEKKAAVRRPFGAEPDLNQIDMPDNRSRGRRSKIDPEAFRESTRRLFRFDVLVNIPKERAQNAAYMDRVTNALETARAEYYAATGLVGPGFVVSTTNDQRLAIALPNASGLPAEKNEIHLDPNIATEILVKEIVNSLRTRPLRLHHLVWEIKSTELPDDAASRHFFSANELAHILKAYMANPDGSVQPTLRSFEWLLKSVPFWKITTAQPSDNLAEIGRKFRLQSAALNARITAPAIRPELAKAIQDLVKSLQEISLNRLEEAIPRVRLVQLVIQPAEYESAEQYFVSLYAANQVGSSSAATQRCPTFRREKLFHSVNIDNLPLVRELLEASTLLDDRAVFSNPVQRWRTLSCWAKQMASLGESPLRLNAIAVRIQNEAAATPPLGVTTSIIDALEYAHPVDQIFDFQGKIKPLLRVVRDYANSPDRKPTDTDGWRTISRIRKFCDKHQTSADCWDLYASISENRRAPGRTRFDFARAVTYSRDTQWPAPGSARARALAALATLRSEAMAQRTAQKGPTRRSRIGRSEVGEADELLFDVEVTEIDQLEFDAGNGDSKAAEQCVARIENLRRGAVTESTTYGKAFVSATLGSCLRSKGDLDAARAVLDRARSETTRFSAHLYQEITQLYLRLDLGRELTALMKDGVARYPRAMLTPPGSHVFMWVLARLFDPEEELADVSKLVEREQNLHDRPFAVVALYWRLIVDKKFDEAEKIISEFREEAKLNKLLAELADNTKVRYEKWPELLVRILFSNKSRVLELERDFANSAADEGSPLRHFKAQLQSRLVDFLFYKTLLDSIIDRNNIREDVLRDGLGRAVAANYPLAIEHSAASGLLRRPKILDASGLAPLK